MYKFKCSCQFIITGIVDVRFQCPRCGCVHYPKDSSPANIERLRNFIKEENKK